MGGQGKSNSAHRLATSILGLASNPLMMGEQQSILKVQIWRVRCESETLIISKLEDFIFI